MELKVSKEEYMNDQIAFEMALHRVRNQATREGKKPTFRELLDLAKVELEQEYDKMKALPEPTSRAEAVAALASFLPPQS